MALRTFFFALMLAAATAATGQAWSQAYPIKPIRIITPFAPGGGSDLIARVVAQRLTESLGQSVIVENRPGAGGTVGTEVGVKALPDGYTYTLVAGSYAVNPSLFKLPFYPINDITAVVQVAKGPFIIVVHPSLPVRGVKDLISVAKTRPGQISYASSGVGSSPQLAAELFSDMAGIKMTHVPYRGTGPAVTDTIAGNVQLIFAGISTALPPVKSGRLRGIAVSTATRSDAVPDIPTVSESGVRGYEVDQWYGLIAPKGLPKPILDRVNGDINKALKNKDMQDRLSGDGVAAAGGTPEHFNAVLKANIQMWGKVVSKTGIKAE
jgi:tripartite-type tricarboxylate transporter receptor subunit TctC